MSTFPSNDGEQVQPSLAVVEAVADRQDCDPLDLPPLHAAGIDADALDALLQSGADGFDGSVTFTYCDFEVTVDGRGGVDLDAVDQ